MELGELVTVMVRAMVDNPEEVKVNELQGNSSSIIELTVTKSDVGMVIGKQGQNADALRIILSAAAAKARRRATLYLID